MFKAAVIGDKTSILGFKALGLDIYPLTDIHEATNIWERVRGKGYAVIFITEEVFKKIEKLMGEAEEIIPAVVIIPGTIGSQGLAGERIRKMVEKAVGADIISKEREG